MPFQLQPVLNMNNADINAEHVFESAFWKFNFHFNYFQSSYPIIRKRTLKIFYKQKRSIFWQ